MSQYTLADKLAAVSGKPTMGRDRVARWERGRQVPRREWRQWLAVVLEVPVERLDAGADTARRQNRLGLAAAVAPVPESGTARRPQGTPALLPVFRSRVQAGILAATLLNPDRAFSLTELAEHAGGSLASVSKEAKLLEDAGILTRRNDGAIRLMRAATDRATLAPLTELIRGTYGVPQIVGEEFGRVAGVARIALTGTWAERFTGVVGPEPDVIQVRLTPDQDNTPRRPDLLAAARRAERRLHRRVAFAVVGRPDGSRRPNVIRPIGTGTAVPVPAPAGIGTAGGLPGARHLASRTTGRTRPHERVRLPRQRGGSAVVHVAPPASSDTPPIAAGGWTDGASLVAELLAGNRLELFSGAAADGRPYFDLAAHHLAAAEDVVAASAGSAYVLVCQAAQLVGCGLLAAQGLRPAAGVDGDVVSRAVIAQFGDRFGHLELLRRRQLSLAHPVGRDNRVAEHDVEAALPAVRSLVQEARSLAPQLDLFG
ncbi:helix-turn-helix domain-containing protein [Jiangella mangrovi]|uniref:DNA-binding transcriptional ArsR family regulator n=1 Tax=Jiangella mangrovi TaxID=1524084 RepID=A0A7W9LPR0_9ACTN|nr:helix-turn-helix domain-containing protein [Jiangella mangrovi]MBB5791683.1 DNA-binding transcriptional ArsR family regulator [Jiangella mangrovi]